MENFWFILLAAFLTSLVSLTGRMLGIFGWQRIKNYLHYLISFAVGALLGVAFLEFLPDALEKAEPLPIFYYALGGFLFFLLLEYSFYWHHCSKGQCPPDLDKATGHLILIGDSIHNFLDGIILAVAFLADFNLGLITTFAILIHEIPQEMSDFAVLLYSGFTQRKALIYNFLVALGTVIGAGLVILFSDKISFLIGPALGITAGAFIYIAAADLIPDLHREARMAKITLLHFFLVILGIIAIQTVEFIL